MLIQGIEYEVKTKAKVRLVETFQDDPSMKNQILLIKNILIPEPDIETVRDMDTEDFERVMMKFAEQSKRKNAEYKKKLSI